MKVSETRKIETCHIRGQRTPLLCLAQRQTTGIRQFPSTKEDYVWNSLAVFTNSPSERQRERKDVQSGNRNED
jgi:hypothetical protein